MDSKPNKRYWTSIDQLDDTPQYREKLLEAYRQDRPEPLGSLSRRNFLALMGASMALAGVAGCRKPVQKIIPYVTQPEEVTPGAANYYATTLTRGTSAYGLIVECHEGRPTKIEGNPDHPSSLGATDVFSQAEILSLYDPDRSKTVLQNGGDREYEDFVTFWREKFDYFLSVKGKGLAVVSEAFASPTMLRLGLQLRKEFPEFFWVTYEPASDENRFAAMVSVSERPLNPVYSFDKADVILSLDADFLGYEEEAVTAARGFSAKRNLVDTNSPMNRLYVAESSFSVTGASADHRIASPSSQIPDLALALANALRDRELELANVPDRPETSEHGEWVNAVADELVESKSRSVVIAGRRQSASVHKLVVAINAALGNIGNTVTYHEVYHTIPPHRIRLGDLVHRVDENEFDTIVVIGGNPVYNAPADYDLKALLKKFKHSVHFSQHFDETSREVEWHIPRAHFLESWGDATSVDGTLSIVQPMIEPLYGGHSDVEFLSLLATGRDQRGYDVVRETWQDLLPGDFEKSWRKSLHDGFVRIEVKRRIATVNKMAGSIFYSRNEFSSKPELSADNLELNFQIGNLHDGRYANNGWLQELPDSITKLAWDNAALVSPATARELGISSNDVVKIAVEGRSIEAPVMIAPGQADYSVALVLGYGRTSAGRIGNGIGYDAYPLRVSTSVDFITGATIEPTGLSHTLVSVQDHGRMEGRPIVREATLDIYRKDPDFAKKMVEHPPLKSIFPDYDYSKGYQWGMVIDLTKCIGCNACTIACQSENNVQIVGREQVSLGREMHWIRNDRYFTGDQSNPEVVYMPIPCQHCENAPCEQVCPVAATVHDSEGLNNMTYNRCIGTRYCSNNCPYKVRRFNFFNYIKDMPEVVKMAQNPDVTVRSRGVMEKCTFCLQRINRAKQAAQMEGREVRDGELKTACEQACPTKAITFGNINDPESRVAKLKKNDRNYELLGELNLRTRNSYLARIRNPNPKLVKHETEEDKHT